MEEFLVHFEINPPPDVLQDTENIAKLYADELEAAKPLLVGGWFRRVWREPGTLNHWALWYAPDANFVHQAYQSFPFFQAGYGRATIHPLAKNPNDPGWPDRNVPNAVDNEIMLEKLESRQGAAVPPKTGSGVGVVLSFYDNYEENDGSGPRYGKD